MIDSLYTHLAAAQRSPVREQLNVAGRDYAVVTLHRPSNVDDAAVLARILGALESLSARLAVVFPVHPRTQARLAEFDLLAGLRARAPQLQLVAPLGYLDFLRLLSGARLVLTDSGGLQEETTALAIPCLTLRANTERPITVTHGTNRVVGTDPARILAAAHAALDHPPASRPPLWDGQAADRILNALQAVSRKQ
jgi:UDP-N-acetylglucosamine 2-epimerase (non-hydrolysing)